MGLHYGVAIDCHAPLQVEAVDLALAHAVLATAAVNTAGNQFG